MWQLKYLPSCVAVVIGLLGVPVDPSVQPVTPEGLKVMPGRVSRVADQIAQDPGGSTHVVFRILRDRKSPVFYSQRTSNVWSEPLQLSADGGTCEDPVVAVCSDGRLVSSWIDTTDRDSFALVVRSSQDGGKSWSAEFRHPSGVTRLQPRLAASGKNVYICFSSAPAKDAPERVYFLRSHDAGTTWVQKDLDFKEARHLSSQVQILTRGEKVWLTWRHEAGAGADVVVNRSTDGGDTWLDRPVTVSEPRPERPVDPTFDPTEKDVVVVWQVVYPGSKAIIYEDRSEDGETWGRDRILFQSKVIPVTYRIVRFGNDRYLLWLGERNLKQRQKAIYWLKLIYPTEVPQHQEVIHWPGGEQADFSEMDVKIIDKKTLFLAAVARFGMGDWRLLLLSRKADGEEQRWIMGEGDRKERSCLALVPFGGSIGWLCHERKARQLPMESLNGSLVFGRLGEIQN
ncbi:MAG: exo-alpha-sialidase [Acidobacteria bacterium]|nr:MAG: exo-alpha-sialidase [Acidobacteriota bacterium]